MRRTRLAVLALLLAAGGGPACRDLSTPGDAGPLPDIQSFTPREVHAGTLLTIEGSNFSANPEQNRIVFTNGTALAETATPTRLSVRVPEAAGSGQIRVTTPAGAGLPFPRVVTDESRLVYLGLGEPRNGAITVRIPLLHQPHRLITAGATHFIVSSLIGPMSSRDGVLGTPWSDLVSFPWTGEVATVSAANRATGPSGTGSCGDPAICGGSTGCVAFRLDFRDASTGNPTRDYEWCYSREVGQTYAAVVPFPHEDGLATLEAVDPGGGQARRYRLVPRTWNSASDPPGHDLAEAEGFVDAVAAPARRVVASGMASGRFVVLVSDLALGTDFWVDAPYPVGRGLAVGGTQLLIAGHAFALVAFQGGGLGMLDLDSDPPGWVGDPIDSGSASEIIDVVAMDDIAVVTKPDERRVLGIDLVRGEMVWSTSGFTPTLLALDGGRVSVADYESNTIRTLDARTGITLSSSEVDVQPGSEIAQLGLSYSSRLMRGLGFVLPTGRGRCATFALSDLQVEPFDCTGAGTRLVGVDPYRPEMRLTHDTRAYLRGDVSEGTILVLATEGGLRVEHPDDPGRLALDIPANLATLVSLGVTGWDDTDLAYAAVDTTGTGGGLLLWTIGDLLAGAPPRSVFDVRAAVTGGPIGDAWWFLQGAVPDGRDRLWLFEGLDSLTASGTTVPTYNLRTDSWDWVDQPTGMPFLDDIVAVSPNGRMAVTRGGFLGGTQLTLLRLDPRLLFPKVATIQISGSISGAAFIPSGEQLYILTRNPDELLIIE